VPVFADLPGFFLTLRVGDKTLQGEADGPPSMTAGQFYTVEATLAGDTGSVPAGADVRLSIDVIYSHVAGVAEFQYALGPEHAGNVEFP
jgi:hypothetical protein